MHFKNKNILYNAYALQFFGAKSKKPTKFPRDDIDIFSSLLFGYYWHVLFPVGFIVFNFIPVILWDESILASIGMAHLRTTIWHHFTFLVNSAAHIWGYKPYEKSIRPVENKMVSILTGGEGLHFLGIVGITKRQSLDSTDDTTSLQPLLTLFAWIGCAYHLKSVPKSTVETRVARTGDGSWAAEDQNDYHIHAENAPWGSGDKDIS